MITKIIKKYRPYLLPMLIISICVFWIVQLQLKANSLASRVEELHTALTQNRDMLNGLEQFYRSVKNNSITLDNSGAYMYSDKSGMLLEDKKANFYCNKSDVTLDEDQIRLHNDNLVFTIRKSLEQMYLGDGNAAVRIGKIPGNVTSTGASVTEQGIMMLSQPSSKKGGYMLLSDNGVKIKSNDVPITIESESTDDFRMTFDKKKEVIELWNKLMRIYLDQQKERIYVGNTNASLRVGKIAGTSYGTATTEEGIIILSEPNSKKGGYVLISDNVLRIKSTDVPLEIEKGDCIISIDDDKIEFISDSDINIVSENGNVNIYGKRINFNEL